MSTSDTCLPSTSQRGPFPWVGLGVCGLGFMGLGFSWAYLPPSPRLDVVPSFTPAASVSAPEPRYLTTTPFGSAQYHFADVPVVTIPVSDPLRVVADRSQSQDARVKPLVDGTVIFISQAQDVALLRRLLRDTGEGDTLRNEAANLLARSEVPELAADLIYVLEQAGEQARFRSFVAQHLGMLWVRQGSLQDGSVYERLLGCLADRHREVRREAVLSLARGDEPSIPAHLASILNEGRDPDLLDLACRIGADKNLKECTPSIRPLIQHDDEIVAMAALDALGRLNDTTSLEPIRLATSSSNRHIAASATRALAALTEAGAP